MPDLLDPKNDYVFKRLFADDPVLLTALINAVRPHTPPITQIEVKNPTINAEELRGKYIILDLLAMDSDGAQFNIEMQVRRYHAWSARSSYYLAKLISGQLLVGDDDTLLKPAIGIHLLDFDLFQELRHQNQALWCFEMRDAETPSVTLGQELQLNLIELRKADRLQQLSGPLADWIALFEHWNEDQRMTQITDQPARAALDKLKRLSGDAEARRLAFVRERALLDERSLLKDARDEGREEGREEGRQEGRQEGREEGFADGVVKGEQRGRDEALRQTAANLIQTTTLDDAAIAAATGLSDAEIAALRRNA